MLNKREVNEGQLEPDLPPYTEDPPLYDGPDQKAKFGVLEPLAGTWVNYNTNGNEVNLGLSATSLPSAGTNSESTPGIFHFLCGNYVEELTFKPIPGGVRDRGGTNELFVGAIEYNQTINDWANGTKGKVIHKETGMYMYLGDLYLHPVDAEARQEDLGSLFRPDMLLGDHGERFIDHYNICRSGTIPHGSTIQLLGRDYLPKDGKPNFPAEIDTWDNDHLTIDRSMTTVLPGNEPIGPVNLDKPRPAWVGNLPNEPTVRKYNERIFAHELYPYSVRPDLRLRDAIKDQNMKKFIFIDMGSRFRANPQGGVLNTPLVQRYCPVTEVKFHLWIETVIEDDGEEVLQLQYEQISFFEFSFFLDGSKLRWPHIQVNTLRKKDWVESRMRRDQQNT